MKKVFTVLLALFLILLTGCLPEEIKHPIRSDISEEAFQQQVNLLRESTVTIKGFFMEFHTGVGSGMIYDKIEISNGEYLYYVVTNQHVIHNQTHVKLLMSTGKTEIGDIYAFSSTPIMDDIPANEDIAVVRFRSKENYRVVNIIPLTSEKNTYIQLSIGQTVFGIGTPIKEENHNFVTNKAIISDLKNGFVRHTANINPGNSGGPLFSYDGTFIGINTQRLEYIKGETVYLLNDSIDVNQVTVMIKKRISELTPKLGIQINDYSNFVSLDYKQQFGQDINFDPYDVVPRNESGIVVIDVGSTRSSHNILKQYDLIKSINGKPISAQSDIGNTLQDIRIGNIYTFEVIRLNKDTNEFENLTLEVKILE